MMLSRLAALPLVLLPAAALAHPHNTPDETPKAEARWPFFGSDETKADTPARGVIRLKRQSNGDTDVDVFQLDGEELGDALRELENAIKDSDALSGLADMMQELAAEVEVERSDEAGTALRFGGEDMLRFKLNRDRVADDALSITGLGRNLTVERETVVENGKTRTRIVIEMDGGEDVDIDLPGTTDAPEPPRAPGRWLDQE